jgi:hypothetical protein
MKPPGEPHILLGLPGCSGLPCNCSIGENHWVDEDDVFDWNAEAAEDATWD